MDKENAQASWTAKDSKQRPCLGFCMSLLGWACIMMVLPGTPLLITLLLEFNPVPGGFGFVFALPVPIVCLAGGVALTRRGRQLRAPSALSIIESNVPFILYLRSFADEQLVDPTAQTFKLIPIRYEESLCRALNRVAPLITVGRPGEQRPEIGAARLYVNGADWQAAVADLLERATAVLVAVGTSGGVRWEIEKALEVVEKSRLLFFFPLVDKKQPSISPRLYIKEILFANSPLAYGKTKHKRLIMGRKERYEAFRAHAQRICSAPLPDRPGEDSFLAFDNKAGPRLLKTVRPSIIHNVLLLRKPGLDINFSRTLEPKLRPLFK